jgi:hypothetical protein
MIESFLSQIGQAVTIYQRVSIALSNCAHVSSPLDLEVPIVAPVGSPRVLHIPEAKTVLRAIASSQDSMVDILGSLAASFHTIHTGSVSLESSNHLEGNRNWASIVETLGKLHLVSLGDVERSVTDIAHCDLSAEDTLSVLGSVGIGDIGLDTSSITDILESVRGKTTPASVVVEVSSTVDQLLLGEGDIAALAEKVPVGFQRAHSREGPARSA